MLVRPKKYRRGENGIEVEALRVTDETIGFLVNWTQGQLIEENDAITGEPHPALNLKTRNGRQRASENQYIVRFNNEFYVSLPSKFENRFEEIS